MTPWRMMTAVGLAVLLVACGRTPPPEEVELAPAEYERFVAAFYTGVTALQVGDAQTALGRLREAVEVAPGEPAAWADLALAQVRANDVEGSAASIARARELEPDDSDIVLLASQIAARQGRTDEAQSLLRHAVELDGRNLRARYALAEELGRGMGTTGDAAAEAEIGEHLEAILAARPANLVALLELARHAAKVGDAALLDRTLARLAPLAEGWDADTRAKLEEVRAGAKAGDVQALATRLIVLGNLLLTTPAYQAGLAEVTTPGAATGEPIERLMRLPPPSASPAEPDLALTLTARTHRPGDMPDPELPEQNVAVDFDNDQGLDGVLAGADGLRLFGTSSDGESTDVTEAEGLDPGLVSQAYTGAWAVDLDLEGDLDLVLGRAEGPPAILRNNNTENSDTVPQNDTAEKWTVVDSPFGSADGIAQLAWADLDGDSDADVALLGPDGALRVYDNERAGRYRLVAPAGDPSAPVRAIAVADPNLDGRLDLVVASGGSIGRRSWDSTVDDRWEVEGIAAWPDAPDDGTARLLWGDLDNNGALDLVATGSGGGRAWLADAAGKLVSLPAAVDIRVMALADLDGDGRLDLRGHNDGVSGHDLVNAGGDKDYRWQVIRPRALASVSGDQRMNSFGLGGDMMVRAGLLAQIQLITGPVVHFGLGTYGAANVVRVRWPNGVAQGEFDLPADKEVVVEQRLKGSCPWLFAHDGRSMAFVTDILWRSPLGLRINAQDTAGVVQTRDWVNVRGDQLAAQDGRYDLRITAELWETHFFDHVALMTVDHPAGTEVFVDERFAIPPPPLEVRVTGPVRPVARAVDDGGRDVTGLVRARDGRHLDTFELGRYQGIARDHFVEVELPPWSGAAGGPGAGDTADRDPHGAQVLVAHGWIYPTDSSINVAISQGPHAPPSDLSLEVPDGRGGWTVAREHLGFPAGKRKTMLIDLDGLFPPDAPEPRRLRLRTNLEVYWDSLAVADARRDVAPQVRTIPAAYADLRYRGFSYTNYTDGSGTRREPEIPDYDRLAAATQIWPDLVGFYTRFGDVRPLLSEVDDRYVILNAGDEIALEFDAPADPPAGWVRDFVFVSDGWEKDGDLNTSYSKTVLPLPSHDRPEYTRPGDSGAIGRLEDDPVYRRHPRDWVDYHTRYVTPERFRRGVWPDLPKGAAGSTIGGPFLGLPGPSGGPISPTRSP